MAIRNASSSPTRPASPAPRVRLAPATPRRRWRTLLVTLLTALATIGSASLPLAASASASDPERTLIVRYHHDGERALDECAETLWKRGRPFASATRDGSASLDDWHRKHRVRRVRAMFRRPDGRPLARQAERIRERVGRARRRDAARRGAAATASPAEQMQRMRRASDLAHVYRIELEDDAALGDALAELRADPAVAFAQPDHRYALDQVEYAPDDPFLESSGSWGQDFRDLWGLDRIRVREAWQTTRGAGQVVAVVDTGLEYDHPDIAENVWVNPGEDLDGNGRVDPSDWNGVDDDDNGFVDDLRGYDFAGFGDRLEDGSIDLGDADPFDEGGHGTHVSGTVAAVANNGIGIAGVAPEARVMALKGFDAEGRGRDSDLWRAVLYAVENGADVVNASWSCNPACPENPLAEEVLAIAEAEGTVFVTSAGNRRFDVVRNAPEKTSHAITVGSLGSDDVLSSFSNRGWLVDLVAPGGDPGLPLTVLTARRNILSLAASTLGPNDQPYVVQGEYVRLAGTSMATPHVAGAVALLRAARPGLTPRDVRRLLRASAEDLGSAGHDALYGAGVLDVARLLETPLADVSLAIEAPAPGAIVDPGEGRLPIEIRARGRDLRAYSLAVSRGLETSDFEQIASRTGGSPAETVDWDVTDLEVGPYVLRLRAELEGGNTLDEYSIVSLERIRPLRLSRDNVEEQAPRISGRQVVWQAYPTGLADSGEVRIGGFGGGAGAEPQTPARLVDSERIQTDPVVAGRRVVWVESDVDSPETELRGCHLEGRERRGCASRRLSLEQGRLRPLFLALGRLLFAPTPGNQPRVAGCRWLGAAAGSNVCRTETIGTSLPSRRLVDFDGRTALAISNGPGLPLEICSPALTATPCEFRPVRIGGAPFSADDASLDGGRLAFELIRPGGSLLGHCRLDPETGDCSDPRLIEGVVDGREPDVSGRRIVWTEFRAGERSGIASCEIDPIDGECLRQRLIGSHVPASAPRIDGHRLVWQDARPGPSQVLGHELPWIRIRERLEVRADRPVRRRFRIGGSEVAGLSLTLEGVSGPAPEAWGAEVERSARGRALLSLDVPRDARVGERAVWRLRAWAPSGIETRSRVEIEVTAPPRRRGAWLARWLRRFLAAAG